MNYDGKKLCNVPDHFGGADCLWPKGLGVIKIHASGKLGQASIPDGVEMAIGAAPDCPGWNRVCGLVMQLSTNRKSAHIVIDTGHIDGPMGTLAWSELPCGFTKAQWRVLQQMYDTGDIYVIADNPPGNRVDFVRVACHEIGHAIGISHINVGNLLAPMYSAQIRWPQRGDIMEAVMRYGQYEGEEEPVTTLPPSLPTTLPPSVPGGGGGGGFDVGKIFPCLLTYGVDIFQALSPEERSQLVKFLIGMWRGLSSQQRQQLRSLSQDRGQELIEMLDEGTVS